MGRGGGGQRGMVGRGGGGQRGWWAEGVVGRGVWWVEGVVGRGCGGQRGVVGRECVGQMGVVGRQDQPAHRGGWVVSAEVVCLTAELLLIHAPNATIAQYMLKELGRKAAGGGTRKRLTHSARRSGDAYILTCRSNEHATAGQHDQPQGKPHSYAGCLGNRPTHTDTQCHFSTCCMMAAGPSLTG